MSEVTVYPVVDSEITVFPPEDGTVTILGQGESTVIITPAGAPGPPGPSLPIVFYRPGMVELLTGKARYRFPFPAVLMGWSAALSGAPTGSDLEFDVVANSITTLFTGVVPDGAEDVSEVPLVVPVAVGDYLTVNVTAVGSTYAGEGLSIFIRYLA